MHKNRKRNITPSEKIIRLIELYESLVKGIDKKARRSKQRAYGGVLRAGKGSLVEKMAASLVTIAWEDLGRDASRLSLQKEIVRVPINENYIEKIRSPEVKQYIRDNIKDFYYPLKTDVHVHVDGQFKIAMECKAYTENAMLKRILVDFTLFKRVYPQLEFVLFQLESQLGGDYSSANVLKQGSPSTHTLLSYFDINLNIITLLEGERKVDKPIHKPDFYKPLTQACLVSVMEVFKNLLQ